MPKEPQIVHGLLPLQNKWLHWGRKGEEEKRRHIEMLGKGDTSGLLPVDAPDASSSSMFLFGLISLDEVSCGITGWRRCWVMVAGFNLGREITDMGTHRRCKAIRPSIQPCRGGARAWDHSLLATKLTHKSHRAAVAASSCPVCELFASPVSGSCHRGGWCCWDDVVLVEDDGEMSQRGCGGGGGPGAAPTRGRSGGECKRVACLGGHVHREREESGSGLDTFFSQ
jgi:hypothetical protein